MAFPGGRKPHPCVFGWSCGLRDTKSLHEACEQCLGTKSLGSRERSDGVRTPFSQWRDHSLILSGCYFCCSDKKKKVSSDGESWIKYIPKSFMALYLSYLYMFLKLFVLVIYFWLCWVFIAVRRLSLGVASGDSFLVVVCGLLFRGASLIKHEL